MEKLQEYLLYSISNYFSVNFIEFSFFLFFICIKLLFQAGLPDPPNMKHSLVKLKEQERKFLEQLLDSSKLENYEISIPLKASLRKYQQVY